MHGWVLGILLRRIRELSFSLAITRVTVMDDVFALINAHTTLYTIIYYTCGTLRYIVYEWVENSKSSPLHCREEM